jgi:mRNA interferase MazF
MPTTTDFEFGDILLVSFPFTNQAGSKRRPAVVVSTRTYNQRRPDVILMAVTSQVRQPLGFGEVAIEQWQTAGLIKPSVVKPVILTAEKRIVIKKLGRMNEKDRRSVKTAISKIIG